MQNALRYRIMIFFPGGCPKMYHLPLCPFIDLLWALLLLLPLRILASSCEGRESHRLKMGARTMIALVWLAGILAAKTFASDLPPVARAPLELYHLFHPNELTDDFDHPGVVVDRSRRGASGSETNDPQSRITFTLYSLGGAPCILAQTACTFLLDYRTLRYGVQTVKVTLPREPEVSGSCVRDGDTAVLTMRWSVFNFSLIFTENPEGNSYYLNKALLKYNQSLAIFTDATYRGPVVLETQRGWNYYFTPLGRSYECQHGEDQGPLKLFNEDDELVGNMTLYNTRFQPFVKRAKGDWGPGDHCLPKAIQVMREDVVPYVVSILFLVSVVGLVGGYGLFRKFNVKKTDYGFYGEDGPPDGGGGGNIDALEMREPLDGKQTTLPGDSDEEKEYIPQQQHQVNGRHQQPEQPTTTNNPFTAKAAKNPFKQ